MTNESKKRRQSKFKMTPGHLQDLDKDTLVTMLVKMQEQYQQLTESMQALLRDKYGPKTEHFVDRDQLRLFSDTTVESSQEASDRDNDLSRSERDTHAPADTKQNQRKRRDKNPRSSNMECIKIRGPEPSLEALTCGCCSVSRTLANEVSRGRRYVYQPARVHLEEFIASIFACNSCGSTLVVEPEISELELRIEADPGLQAVIAVERFDDSMPLNRQERRFARIGVPIARSTMVGWLRFSSKTLRPLYDRMHVLLLQSNAIATDDSPMKVLDRSKKKNIKLGRVWIYRGDDTHPFNLFDYTAGRGRDGPLTFLRGFNGYLMGDCFSGNQALCAETGATHVACNAHARRYFIKAQQNNQDGCSEILRMYRQLFKIESDAKELGVCGAELKLMREQESKPLLATMKEWLDRQVLTALPKSSFGKAVNYSLNNWDELTNFLLDGELRADNNLAEQEMKRVTINRKNSLFFGSDQGGEDSEVLMSLISTCRRHGVEPWAYLRDVITVLTKNPNHDLDSLLPHNWQPLTPDISA